MNITHKGRLFLKRCVCQNFFFVLICSGVFIRRTASLAESAFKTAPPFQTSKDHIDFRITCPVKPVRSEMAVSCPQHTPSAASPAIFSFPVYYRKTA
jgi:hypothetical protein